MSRRTAVLAGTVVISAAGMLAPATAAPAEGPPAARVAPAVAPASVAARAAATRATMSLQVRATVSNQAPTKMRLVVRAPRKKVLPSGVLRVSVDGHRVASVRYADRRRRVATKVTLPRLAVGRHRVRAAYRHRGRAVASGSTVVTSRRGCAWLPSACGFPDASNTGVQRGVALRSVPGQVTRGPGWRYNRSSGDVDVTGRGAVVSGISTTGTINVTADNVTIKNVRIRTGGDSFGIALRHTTNATIDHVEITAPAVEGPNRLMNGVKDIYGDTTGTVVQRSDISRTATGIQMATGTIRDNYIHDLGYKSGDHVNGTTSNGDTRQLNILHNTVFNQHSQTDAISLFPDFGTEANRRIEGNLVAGGGYTIYAGANGSNPGAAVNIVVRNNRFAKLFYRRSGYYGPVTAYAPNRGNQWTGNVWDDTGQRVRP